MSSLPTCTSPDYLAIHTQKSQTLDGEALIEYLLDSLPYIKAEDSAGYLTAFGPSKKLTKNDLAQALRDQYKCQEKGCTGDLVDCGGAGVCAECAIVAWEGLGPDQGKNLSYERSRTTLYRIHRYVRLVHFKDLMRALQGEMPCKLPPDDEERVRACLGNTGAITPTTVLAALKKCKLTKKFRKHKEYLAWYLSERRWTGVVIRHADYMQMCKMFKVIERMWDLKSSKKFKGKRKVFLSYPYVFWRLSQLIGHDEEYCRDVQLLKSKKLLAKQHELWKGVCIRLGWREL